MLVSCFNNKDILLVAFHQVFFPGKFLQQLCGAHQFSPVFFNFLDLFPVLFLFMFQRTQFGRHPEAIDQVIRIKKCHPNQECHPGDEIEVPENGG